ncbi:class I adenylate-forming enzyme family protein [Thiohalomonas denitrificans]|uniref:Acyl-CoA synthetase (AMP-forming)/AMP-acid ligase II n=1 Tax=Thiohalomonas denitrificans TaxID=415747 RepID=A0A1G5PKP6_9GAMM|nr:class I adenylate-forming enzyme family protein [Thiohalomonas denitrificans]SCZ50067.1 Acyl-CoA synthetase (AMP-forming)/AMP-acid ligase II [Thiohalomonas denitrificans]
MDRSIVHQLEASVIAHGDRGAIRHDALEVTYNQLWSMVRAVCGFFRRRVNRGDRVILALPNGVEYVAAYYGIIAAGAVVVPLRPDARNSELAAMASRVEAKWLITEGADHAREASCAQPPTLGVVLVGSRFPGVSSDAPVVAWDAILTEGSSDPDYDALNDSDRLTTLACTSGTTGNPKAVMITNGNLEANTRSILGYLHLQQEDTGLCLLPLNYAYGTSILNTHMAAGARLVIGNGMAYPHVVRELLAQEEVSGFFGVPTTYYLALQHGLFAQPLPRLRYLAQAGGGMRADAVDQVRAQLPGVAFYVMYGQTEATARLTWLPPERWTEKRGSIGMAIPGVELSIRDEEGKCVVHGSIGELCARGQNIMAGYWRNPKATDEVLRDGWLHTGDLSWQDADGYFYLVGRADEMIKSGGHRFSPGAVEEVIARHPDVKEVAVVGIDDELLGQVVRAVVVPLPESSPGVNTLLRFCRHHLPPHMLPRELLFSDQLPTTPSGKVRRKMLAGMRWTA